MPQLLDKELSKYSKHIRSVKVFEDHYMELSEYLEHKKLDKEIEYQY